MTQNSLLCSDVVRYETTHSLTLVLTIVSQICINIDVIVIIAKCTY